MMATSLFTKFFIYLQTQCGCTIAQTVRRLACHRATSSIWV